MILQVRSLISNTCIRNRSSAEVSCYYNDSDMTMNKVLRERKHVNNWKVELITSKVSKEEHWICTVGS